MRVLITGFEPFDGAERNASGDGVQAALPLLADLDVVGEVLPVEFARAGERVRELVATWTPDVTVCFGVANTRGLVTPERIAVNVDDARIPDNVGAQPVDATIEPGGPDGVFSTLPVREIVAALGASGVASGVSDSAGTYVCNHVMYSLLRCVPAGAWGGFVHLPAELDAPGAVVETVVRACVAERLAVQ